MSSKFLLHRAKGLHRESHLQSLGSTQRPSASPTSHGAASDAGTVLSAPVAWPHVLAGTVVDISVGGDFFANRFTFLAAKSAEFTPLLLAWPGKGLPAYTSRSERMAPQSRSRPVVVIGNA